eukprot:gene7063-10833_t
MPYMPNARHPINGEWLREHAECPVTRKPLSAAALAPNRGLGRRPPEQPQTAPKARVPWSVRLCARASGVRIARARDGAPLKSAIEFYLGAQKSGGRGAKGGRRARAMGGA